jgi:hypothetical protein
MPDPSALLGTWKMVSWTRKVLATGEVSDAMGPDPIGYIAYHADGRMMALVLKSDRPPFTGPRRTRRKSGCSIRCWRIPQPTLSKETRLSIMSMRHGIQLGREQT